MRALAGELGLLAVRHEVSDVQTNSEMMDIILTHLQTA